MKVSLEQVPLDPPHPLQLSLSGDELLHLIGQLSARWQTREAHHVLYVTAGKRDKHENEDVRTTA